MASELKVDTISEKTTASGVTIDGVKLKDNAVETNTISEGTSGSGVTIDGVLLKDGIAHSGLVKIDDHDFSTSTSVTRDGVFSSTYDNYKIFVNITDGSATTVQCGFRLRASSTSTTSNYGGHRNYVATGGTDLNHGSSFGTSYIYFGDTDSGSTDATCADITLYAPNLAAPTKYLGQAQGFWNSNFYSQQVYGYQTDNTQFDGLEIYTFAPGGATITGNIQIFGMK